MVPSVAALNVYSVSLADFAHYMLNAVLPAAALVSDLTSYSYSGYNCRTAVIPLGFNVNILCADSSERGGDIWQRPRVLPPPNKLLQCVKLA